MVTFHNLQMLLSLVHPLLESLCEAKEEAMAAENETGHQRDLTMLWEKGFLFMGIQRGFFEQKP